MTDSILVPRELLERVAGTYVGGKHRAGVEALGELRDLLAQPASEPKPVDDAEPVAYRVLTNFSSRFVRCMISAEDCAKHLTKNGELNARIEPLFTHPAPAGVVKLPKRLPPEHWMAYGWNACLDEVKP